MSKPRSRSSWRRCPANSVSNSANAIWKYCGCWAKAAASPKSRSSLGLGYKTVANTATAIKSKLGVARTADLIRLSVEMGIGRQVP